MENGQILYYYTSLAVLMQLLENGELTLFSSKTNEKTEQLFYLRKFLYASKKLSKINPSRYNDLVADIFAQARLQIYPFITLSLTGNDAKEWQENGNDGYGVCIGFKINALEKLLKNTPYPLTLDYEQNAIFKGNNLLFKGLETYLSEDFDLENKEKLLDLLLTKSLLYKKELPKENRLRFLKLSSPFSKNPTFSYDKTFKLATTVQIEDYQELLAEIIIGEKSNLTPQQLKSTYQLENINISK